ncbi:MAG TPA: hypothetical protein VE219_00370, partial [Candidatus Sulfotelmatobacter sp.]|nr:hypothetical protein [Candidatus Sulfotelmatobacter sp.]
MPGFLHAWAQHRAQHCYDTAVAEWHEELAGAQRLLDEARSFRGTGGAPGIVLARGEHLFLQVAAASLVESRVSGGHWEGRSQGISVPIAHIGRSTIRYHVGR